jgi:multimeric flavodoxin WrbA
MKIIAIMGSPRKFGNSYKIVKRIEERMKESDPNLEFNYLFLRYSHLELCQGCGLCLSHGEDRCPLKDDRKALEKKMLDADGVIFLSPVYAMNVTATMKNFLDRFSYALHRPRFFNQQAMIVCTAGAVGLKEAIDRLAVIKFAGFNLVHTVGFITPMGPISEKSRKKIDRDITVAANRLYNAMAAGTPASPGLINLIAFRSQQAAFALSHEYHLSDCDYLYFREKGWLDGKRQYYIDVGVNPLKSLIARIIGRWVRRNIAKEMQGIPWYPFAPRVEK